MNKIITTALLFFAASVFLPSNAKAQLMHSDSAFTILQSKRTFGEKLLVKNDKDWLNFDDSEKTDKDKGTDNDSYGIGNVIGKKKKSVKAKKKAGKKFKVEFKITQSKVLAYEIHVFGGDFSINRVDFND
ncbi:MAG: hypothetical protein ACPGLV_01720 [Bacteroidia bacterium]